MSCKKCQTKEEAYRNAIADAVLALWDHRRTEAIKILNEALKEHDAPRYEQSPV